MIHKLAIEGGRPIRKKFLPFSIPYIGKEEIDEVIKTLKSGWLTTGPKVKIFEENFKDYIKAKYAIAVNSCTAALHLSLLGFNIGNGDEVLTTPLTFASTANVIMMVNAKPVFVDIDEKTYNIDSKLIEEKITTKTKAIIPVHMGGYPVDMDPILKIAKKYGLYVIEDAAHAAGAEYNGKKIGSLSHSTCFSFYATKTITTGEGGIITTNDYNFSEKVRMLSLHGLSKDAWNRYGSKGTWYYEILDLGYKYNMTDIQASLGIWQLKKIDFFTHKRREIAQKYNQAFSTIDEIILPPRDTRKSKHIYHLYTIRLLLNKLKIDRDYFIKALREENIGSSVHFIPIHLHPFYKKKFNFKKGDFEKAERVFESIISLPIYPTMSDKDINDVINAVIKIIEAKRVK